jgi:pimeloyl-ACP methyl ester carboxylesterase
MAKSRSVLPPLVGVVTLAALSLMAFNAAIRVWMRAPRISVKDNPSAFGLPFRDVLLPTSNSKQIHGWYIPATVSQPAPTLIVLHGWGGNREMMLPLADPFYHSGYALLFVDARSHGASEDDSFSSLPRFAEDLESALDWLLQQPETDRARIGLIGHSVGAAASLLVASRRKEVAAVVSLASFAHPERIMRRYLDS